MAKDWYSGEEMEDTDIYVIIIFSAGLSLMPIISFIVLQVMRSRLKEDKIRARISNLYSDIKLRENDEFYNIWYYPVFLGRRIIFAVTPIFL